VAAGYDEPFRPQYHFSPQRNWTNDPNGLIWFEGEYHLFFQYNPLGDKWGHMSWGHAVSPDLLHWKELPVALAEEDGVMIFTGSTVIDDHNTTGFCAGKPCMVAVYTGHGHGVQTQNLAYSNDRGRTWTKYSGNPVLNLNLADFRDPGVFWSKQSKRWIMAVALPNDHKVRIYGSPDLKKWDQLSEFGPAGATGGQWECPVLFPVGDRWVLKVGLNPGGVQGGSGEQYFIGNFDGTKFVNDNPADLTLWTDYGKDCYCALPFNNLPTPILLGWMNNWQYADKVPTSPWRGQMTIPRELALRTFPEGVRLVQQPVRGLAKLRGRATKKLKTSTFDIEAALDLNGADEAAWKLTYRDGSYTTVGYNATRQELYVDRTQSGIVNFSDKFPARTAAPLTLTEGKLKVRILGDRDSLEVFSSDGRVAITNLIFPRSEPNGFIFESAGKARQTSLTIWPMKSTWTSRTSR